ncbi:MAG: hypothetical protein K6G07_01610 [Lachnospiraceae bacterium]|nr:hypothetical protein [Lachnospiraceae bacterium]
MNMIEFQGAIPRVQDYSAMKSQEDMRNTINQSQFQQTIDKHVDEKSNQIQQSAGSDASHNDADAREKGKNEYYGDGGRNRKKKDDIPMDGKVVVKRNGHFEASV